ncbi:MAG: response regulator [Lachnospiraceae bacterium]|nr:response regulator [Lachnospiraceae bacterium]
MLELSQNTKKRILIVDDDAEQLEILRSFLEPTYLVGTVSHGEFALEYIREYQTDLILMDVVMPQMDGFATLRAIRQSEKGHSIPVIFITGKNSRNIVLQTINVGTDGYLIKPIAKDTLLEKIRSILETQVYIANKKTVLSVDDDVTYLKIINNSLKERFNVIMVNTPKLGREYLERHIPDAIIISENFPGEKMPTFFEELKSEKALSNIPVIMLKSIGNKQKPAEGQGLTADKYLIKPVSKLDLMKAIISAMNSK